MRIFKKHMFCEPLRSNSSNKNLINDFYIEREKEYTTWFEKKGEICGLAEYLKHCAWEADLKNETRVYVVKTYFTHEIVAYFALKAGMVSIDSAFRNKEKEFLARENGIKLVPDTLSGIEISHFAINDAYRKRHNNVKGLGRYIYPTFIYPIIEKCSKDIGISLAYLYAADSSDDDIKKLVNYYKEVFEFEVLADADNKLKPVTSYYDNGCIFMYKLL